MSELFDIAAPSSIGDWYAPVRDRHGRGTTAARPGGLAGLHHARLDHDSQFFTPEPVARFMWDLVAPSLDALFEKHGRRIALFDNSVGSGRLFQFAEPAKHVLYGADIDASSIEAFGAAAKAAGFKSELIVAGLEELDARHMMVGLINPPFSIHLESPLLKPLICNTYGRFGPGSSAKSHDYALHQALDACAVVVAVLPDSAIQTLLDKPELASGRLHTIYRLPAGSFRAEGTDVSVSIALFDEAYTHRAPAQIAVGSDLKVSAPTLVMHPRRDAQLRSLALDDSEPAVLLPVTGDKRVRITHCGRKLNLHFNCGLTQAKVLNAVYGSRLSYEEIRTNKIPPHVVYIGQGALDLEMHLATKDPWESLNDLFQTIRAAGGGADPCQGLLRHFEKRLRRSRRQSTPFAHDVWVADAAAAGEQTIRAVVSKRHVADTSVWGSPLLSTGQSIELRRDGADYVCLIGGKECRYDERRLRSHFEVEQVNQAGWETVYPGLHVAYPAISQSLRARAKQLGIEAWLSWEYQLEDLIELSMKPHGALCAWEQGLGKARLASALILLSGVTHGLLVVEPYLVDEMIRELEGLPIPRSDWKVIERPEALDRLAKINVITYNRLRLPLTAPSAPLCDLDDNEMARTEDDTSASKLALAPPAGFRLSATYAHALRRRCGLVVADEADSLANRNSQRTQALWHLAARKRYGLSGTAIANYPRDLLGVLSWCGTDGTAAQPYSLRRPFVEAACVKSMLTATRGQEKFLERFVSLEWVTNAFLDTAREGAKREVPRIADVSGYRKWIAPLVKRRLAKEPAVAKYITIPDPTEIVTTVQWNQDHLAYYLTVADEFAQWYRKVHEDMKGVNLVTLLARIQAVQFACNLPQRPRDGFGSLTGLTSKQQYVLDRTRQLVDEKHKIVVYSEFPGTLDIYHRHLTKAGIDSVVVHGGRPIKARTAEMNARYRFGDTPVLLASYGCFQAGTNLHCADRVINTDLPWSAKRQRQSDRRLCRPQQVRDVVVERVLLAGSIDDYQREMVLFKGNAADAGLDWAAPISDDVHFLHIDTLLGRFVEDLAKVHGMEMSEFREQVKARREVVTA